MSDNLIRKAILPLTVLVSVGCIALLQTQRLEELTQETDTPLDILKRREKAEQISINILKQIPTFGFDNLIADWGYLNFLSYFGDTPARDQTGYSLSGDYFELVVQNDPRFGKAYTFLNPATSIHAGEPATSVALTEEALARVQPGESRDTYYAWMYKGFDELLYLGDNQAAQKSFETAANWAEYYDDRQSQGLANRARELSQFVATDPDSANSQIGAWVSVLTTATDNLTRQRAIAEIERLGGTITIFPDGRVTVSVPEEE